jgi:Tfp pilus assembly protein PilN
MRAVNLIPAEQRGGAPVGAGRSEGGAYAVLALMGGLAILAALYGHARHEVSSRRGQAASLAAQAQQAQAATTQLAPYTSFIALRQARVQAVSQLAGSRFDWAHVFHEFGRVLPSDVSITSLSGTVGATSATSAPAASSSTSSATSSAKGSAVTSATPPGTVPTFTLTGCATSQRAVAQTLGRLRLIDGVSAVTLQSSTAASTSGTSSASAGAGGAAGGCPAADPVFNIQMTFEPLPAAAASAPSTAVASDSTGGVR